MSKLHIAICTSDDQGRIPEGAALVIEGEIHTVLDRGMLRSGAPSTMAVHRLATTVEKMGYRVTEHGMKVCGNAAGVFAFLVYSD